MEILVTSTTEDQRFATAGGHDLYPTWFLSAFISVEVFERTNMVHLNGLGQAGRPAMLTDVSQEPPFEFRSVVPLVSLKENVRRSPIYRAQSEQKVRIGAYDGGLCITW